MRTTWKAKTLAVGAAVAVSCGPAMALSNKNFRRFVYWPTMVVTVVVVGPFVLPAILVEKENMKRLAQPAK